MSADTNSSRSSRVRWGEPSTRREVLFAASLILGFVAISYYAIRIVSFLFAPLFLGSIFALAFYPVFKWIHQKLHFSRDLAGLLLTLLIGFIMVSPFVLLILTIVSEASTLVERVSPLTGATSRDLATYLQQNPSISQLLQMIGVSPEEFAQQITKFVQATGEFVFRKAREVLFALPGLVFNFLILLLTMFFAFRDGSHFVKIVRDFIPLPEDTLNEIFCRFVDTTYAVLFGMVGTSLYQATMMTIGFLLTGVPYAFLLGFVGFLVSLLGLSPLVWVPGVLYVIVVKENLVAGIILLIFFIIFVATVDNFLRPYLISRRVKLHPLPLIIFIFGGLLKFGFIGLFIGPIVLALFITSAELVRKKYFPAPPPPGAEPAQEP